MLASWTELLPLFVIRWLAHRCGMFSLGRSIVVQARPDVLIVLDRWESDFPAEKKESRHA